jgi:hypothetical protein
VSLRDRQQTDRETGDNEQAVERRRRAAAGRWSRCSRANRTKGAWQGWTCATAGYWLFLARRPASYCNAQSTGGEAVDLFGGHGGNGRDGRAFSHACQLLEEACACRVCVIALC